jgi:hypothetical protein
VDQIALIVDSLSIQKYVGKKENNNNNNNRIDGNIHQLLDQPLL